MAAFEPTTPAPDNVTDRLKVERIKASGPGDNTEETEWVFVVPGFAQSSAPADPGCFALWVDTVDKVVSWWDDGDGAWVGITPTVTTEYMTVALSDSKTTVITTDTAVETLRIPFAGTLVGVRASLGTASSSGVVTVDINKNGTTMLSTKLTIDASEETSVTAATAAVISVSSIAADDEITFDIDTAGTGAKGLKVTLVIERAF